LPEATAAERIARRSRTITIAGLVILAVLAWAYLLSGAGMNRMSAMPGMGPGWPLIFSMWSVMMVAMMVPSAAPAILLYARVHRHSGQFGDAPHTAAFAGGYLLCWLAFSAVAATLQQELGSLAFGSRPAAAALLMGTGAYQLSPFKDACLSRCRSPAEFLARHFRPGSSGALRLGLLHGAYCVGCCWMLMTLLFVGGIMNLVWVAGLTLLVAAEKLLPGGTWIARISGAGLIGWGAYLLAA
jgi:predicted metal-binding membrane protein